MATSAIMGIKTALDKKMQRSITNINPNAADGHHCAAVCRHDGADDCHCVADAADAVNRLPTTHGDCR